MWKWWFFSQCSDWDNHNAVLGDLTVLDWPVYYSNSSDDSMLTYYIGQYIVPAFIGKLFQNFRVAEVSLSFWNFIGVFIAYILLGQLVSAIKLHQQLFVLLIFIFFNGLIVLGRGLYACTPSGSLDTANIPGDFFGINNTIRLHYPSNTDMLRWAFAQSIVP